MYKPFMVSIIIPTYNRSSLFAEAIHSCIAQTYRPIECIVVDDGSTDDTENVIIRLQENIDNDFTIKYIFQSKRGSQVARNTGTAIASGEFIQYLDSDDLLYPDKLSIQVQYLQLNPDCSGVFGDWEHGESDQHEFVQAYLSRDIIYQLLADRPIANFSFLMRNDLIKLIGDWDNNISRNQEIDYHLRGLLTGAIYHYLPGTTGLWRTHEGQRIFNNSTFSSAIGFYQKWETILKEKSLWTPKLQHGVVGNYMWFLGAYPHSSNEEMVKLLQEIKRLEHIQSIFNTYKFKVVQLLLGEKTAMSTWVNRYKKSKKSRIY